jgi:hypothetical protein
MSKMASSKQHLVPQIFGAKPLGVTKKVASSVGSRIKNAFIQDGRIVTVKGTSFIPATKVQFGKDEFQVMANTVIEISSPGGTSKQSKSVDSVVTIGRDNGSQILKRVEIPSRPEVEA